MRTKRRKLSTCTTSWEVADFLARRIRKLPEYADCQVNRYGPFGLTAESSVSVTDGDDLLGFLTIRQDFSDGTFLYVDYNAPWVRQCEPGSIAYLNGLQYAEKPLPEELDAVIQLVFEK